MLASAWVSAQDTFPVITENNFDQLTLTATFNVGYITGIDFTDEYLAVGSYGGVAVFRMEAAQPEQSLSYTNTTAVALNSANDRIAFVANQHISVNPTTLFYSDQAGQRLEQHSEPITQLLYTPDGELYSADQGGIIIHWDVNGNSIEALQAADASITALVISPDGTITSGDANGTIWQWHESAPAAYFSFDNAISALSWSSTGLLAIATNDGKVGWLDNGTFSELPTSGTQVAWSPEADQLAVGDLAGTVTLWDITTKNPAEIYEQTHSQPITVLKWKGDYLVSAGLDGQVVTQNTITGQMTNVMPFACCVEATAHNDASIFTAHSDLTLWRFDIATEIYHLIYQPFNTSALAVSPSGQYVVAFDNAKEEILLLQQVAATDPLEYRVLDKRAIAVQNADAMALSADDAILYLATSYPSTEILALSIPDLNPIWRQPFSWMPVKSLMLTPDNQ